MSYASGALAALAVIAGCADRTAVETGSVEQLIKTCVELPAAGDATLSIQEQRTAFGKRPTLRTGGLKQSLLKFDLSPIPAAAAIESASLRLAVAHAPRPSQVYFHRVTAPWEESAVTFASFAQRFDWRVVGTMSLVGAPVLKSIDLTQLTQRWHSKARPNYGVVMWGLSPRETAYVSRESGSPAQRPALTVCYTTPEDYCAAGPCQNGAACSNTATDYVCACAPGYEGKNCEIEIDECAAKPCENGGTCEDGIAGYTCNCPPGFEGANCEINVDECEAKPCQNGGVCTDGAGGYTCDCPPGYEGTDCEKPIDSCAGNPCQNGAACSPGPTPGSYSCACAPGYGGTNCEINLDDCAGAPCQNGGTCIDGVGSYTCSCAPGWGGPQCETNLNLCAQSPCLNGGTCENGFGTYTCTCAPGYEGTNCEIDTDDCAGNPCQNGGTCTDGVGAYTCSCQPGYTGPACETEIDECSPNPCQNGGACTDGINSYTCACPPGYGGPACEINLDDCSPNPCQNGGTCSDGVNSYTCACPAGYGGPACEINLDECSPNPCQNGGACTDGINTFTCACPTGYGGPTCAVNLDECSPNPCQNGGTCSDGIGTYTCACPAGYSGTNCEVNIDDCAPNPCLNGGACIDGVASFSCQCTIDWVGTLCQTNACEDGNPCTLDDNTPAGCTYAPSPGSEACQATTQSFAAGAFHTCTIREGGKVYCWGRRDEGQLGIGATPAGYALAPVPVTDITDAVAVAAGYEHACAVRASGAVVCWGNGVAGQLGNGTTASSLVPTPVLGITDAISVAAGRRHTCVLRATGEIWCFGQGIQGQLGNGSFASSLAPVKVIDDADLVGPLGSPLQHAPLPWSAVAASDFFTCGLRPSGQVLCWGVNGNGQLGFGGTGNRSQPALVADLTDALAIATGVAHSCAVRSDGTVACWGSSFGLARTGADLLTYSLIGPPLAPFAGAATISASGTHTCVTTVAGGTWCWGQSQQGQLAQVLASAVPVAIPGAPLATSSVATTSGRCHSCTLLEDGSLRCWGSQPNSDPCRSQLGWGSTSGSYTPVTPLLPPP